MGDEIFADAQPAVANNIGKPWKPEHLTALKLGLDSGKTYEQIATSLGRNEGGILAKIKLEVKALSTAGKTKDEIRSEWNITEEILNEYLGAKQTTRVVKPRVVKVDPIINPVIFADTTPFEKKPPIGNTPAGGIKPAMFTDVDSPSINTLIATIDDYRKQVESLKKIVATQALIIEQLQSPPVEELMLLE